MSDYQFINYSVVNRVARISLNAPKTLNAINQTMRLELIELVAKVEVDPNVRVVVLTGEGDSFCSGADLAEGALGYVSFVDQCEAEYTPWLMGIHDSSKLYIAAVKGAAAGVGSAIAMNCDLMVMAEDAYLYQAFSAIGLMPDGGANWLLLQKLGYQRALEMAVDAGRLTATQCKDLGIANKVVPASEVAATAQAWAEHLVAGAPLVQKAVKGLMRRAHGMTYQQVIEEESVLQSALTESEDSVAAIKAFFSKQKPAFNGR